MRCSWRHRQRRSRPMIGETAEVGVKLKLYDELSGGLSKANAGINQLNKNMQGVSSGFSKIKAGFQIGLGVYAVKAATTAVHDLFGVLQSGIASLEELEQVTNLTNAAIKSTGNAAHVSSQQVRDL